MVEKCTFGMRPSAKTWSWYPPNGRGTPLVPLGKSDATSAAHTSLDGFSGSWFPGVWSR